MSTTIGSDGPEPSDPRHAVSRRDFVSIAGLAAAWMMAGKPPADAVAGPFAVRGPDDFPIPSDKKFTKAWLDSLTARGEPTAYRGEDLKHIGMPIGGLCAGHLYLGGDGRLWLWDIFNLPPERPWRDTSGPFYANPAPAKSPIEQGFAIKVTTAHKGQQTLALDRTGFGDETFTGQYPVGLVEYKDPSCPVSVRLRAFSPFIPLNADDSSLPVTVMQFTITNNSIEPVVATLAGWLQNAASLGAGARCVRGERVEHDIDRLSVECSAANLPGAPEVPERPDIPFEDFEKPTYAGWTVTGTAFGDGPIEIAKIPIYQGDVNGHGSRVVNSHNARGGEDIPKADAHIGTLTSPEFTVERNFISLRLGGGNHPGQTCFNVLVDGAVVRSVTGRNENLMHIENIDVSEFAGRRACVQIVDAVAGGWGNIGVDDIIFTDRARKEPFVLEERPDFGTIALALVGDTSDAEAFSTVADGAPVNLAFGRAAEVPAPGAQARRLAVVRKRFGLGPRQEVVITFVVAWRFDRLWPGNISFLTDSKSLRRWYGTRFVNAADVVRYVAKDFQRLSSQTELWRRTWYDSTLPHWLLDRTILNISILATSTCLRLNNGRFYGWEGTYCCPGTCTHVWQYAQAVSRLFPQLERSTREMVDFGLAFHDDSGLIDYRAEAGRTLAIDGQAGTILRAYREHQTSPDEAFLRKVWPRVKKAVGLLLARDTDRDGILDGAQYNTLDASWYGQIAWTSSLYLAALRAGEAMAREMGDDQFADACRDIAQRGSTSMVDRLFNGEYFIHRPDPAHPEANSTGNGCHIDQLFGQSWAHQVGLGRIVPLEQSLSALRSLWKYSFAPDIGPYRSKYDAVIKGGRWYAMPGEGGLLMCTWPKGGVESAAGKGEEAWAAGYFNECMSGFEYQVAAHMIFEGLVTEGLAITKMIHDRYHASRRNPWNEVECSNHYARAMASYGVFIAVCGFEYHGPRGHIGFAPGLTPERFRAPFTAAEGWGTFDQSRDGRIQRELIEVKWGRLRVRTLAFAVPVGATVALIAARLGDRVLAAKASQDGKRVLITLDNDALVREGEALELTMSF